jgi:hypothetical protein
MSDRCLLYPQKRTLELSRAMSALCQKQTLWCVAREVTRKPLLTAIANKPSVQLLLSFSSQTVMAVSSCK